MCNEALDRVRALPIDLKFYPINQDLSPSWNALERDVKTSIRPAALVLVHYFGVPNDIKTGIDFCRSQNMFLIEDSAHMLFPTESESDALFFSPHKLLPVGSCGVAVCDAELYGYLPSPADRARRF